jgi:hypothetical protein
MKDIRKRVKAERATGLKLIFGPSERLPARLKKSAAAA